MDKAGTFLKAQCKPLCILGERSDRSNISVGFTTQGTGRKHARFYEL